MTDEEILVRAAEIRIVRQREHEEAARLRYLEAQEHAKRRLRREITDVLHIPDITDEQLSEIIVVVSDYMN
jgi:hypothetical protein